MEDKDNLEKKLTIIWIIAFILAIISYIGITTLINTRSHFKYNILVIFGIIFPVASIFGCCIFQQTRKPIIIKILMIIIIPLFVLCTTIKFSDFYAYSISPFKLNIWSGSDLNDNYNYVKQYNAEFVAYDGESNVKGADVKTLIRNVMTHNRANSTDTSLWINVHVNDSGSIKSLEKAMNLVKNDNQANDNIALNEYNHNIRMEMDKAKISKTYAVACGYDPVTGYVVDIEIVLNEK